MNAIKRVGKGIGRLSVLVPLFGGVLFQASAQNRIADTPSLIQDGFGPGGYDLQGDGSEYCGPTTANIMLGYLANQGFTQLLPSNASNSDYLNLERIMIGLSDASFTSGAYWANVQTAMTMYAHARGIQQISFQSPVAPDLDFFANAQTDRYTATALNIQWLQLTSPTGNDYNDTGGHFVGVSGVNTVTGELVLSNPMPSALFNVADLSTNNPQYAETIPFTGTSSGLGPGTYLQFNYNQANSVLSNTTTGYVGVIYQGYAATIHPDELPGGGWSPSTWTLDSTTNQFTFNDSTLEVIAPLAGSVGIEKDGNGTLLLRSTNVTTGANDIKGGVLKTTASAGSVLGSGSLTLEHATIDLVPDDAAPSDVVLNLAVGTGSGLSYSGGSRLLLEPGANTSLTVTIGDAAQTKAQNFSRTGSGTFVLQLANGISNLGGSTQVYINGLGSLPENNGMLHPHVIGADSDGSGTFLTYGSSGFAAASYTSSSSVGIGSTTASTVYDVVNNQAVSASSTAAVYALRVTSGRTVGGGDSASELQVGGQASGDLGGVILNQGAVIDVASLQFGSGNALIYSSGSNNAIHSNITANQFTKFGSGDLHLDGNNQISGTLAVQSGTLHLEGTSNPSGGASISLGAGTLVVASGAVVTGTITSKGGHLALAGGTVASVVTDVNSKVSGGGTISGDAYLQGVLAPGLNQLNFQGSVSMDGNGMLAFTLGSLVDNTNGVAGQDWSLFTFNLGAGDTLDLDGFSFENDFDLIASTLPNSGNSFWNTDHSWLLMESTEAFNGDGNTFSPSWGFPAYEQGHFYWGTAFVAGATYEHQLTMHYVAVPEPETWALVLMGVGVLFYIRKRRAKRLIT